ncbi:MAG: hypothetical protein JNK05_03375 [Myxococcales bacterium]|nr:hypothetical protein [Myxococcales bacterium]
MFDSIVRAVFGSRGAVLLYTPSLVVQPGATIPVHVRFEALEVAREVAFLRLHLHMTVHQWTQGPAGPTIQPQTRDVLPPIVLTEKFVVAAGAVQDFTTTITIPHGVYPSVPGQIDYALWAVAPVAGQTIDSAQHLPLTIVGSSASVPFAPVQGAMPPAPPAPIGPMGAPFPPPMQSAYGPVAMGAPLPPIPFAQPSSPSPAPPAAPAAPPAPAAAAPFAPGDDVEARAPDQSWQPAMIVESRGPVLLVQWNDGRPATWVRADQVRHKPAPVAEEPKGERENEPK